MDFFEAAEEAGFIPDRNRRAFIEALTRQDPQPDSVLPPHPEEQRLQGDLFDGLEFLRLKGDGTAVVRPQLSMVLNNSCDLQPDRSKYCNVALAMDYSRYEAEVVRRRETGGAADFLNDAKANRVDHLLYLQSVPQYESGAIVFLNVIATLPIRFYEAAVDQRKRIGSLSQHGFYFFLIKLTRFLARIESADVARQT